MAQDADAEAKLLEMRRDIRTRCVQDMTALLGEHGAAHLQDWLTDGTVDRFLKANNDTVDGAVDQLCKSWAWRVETQPRWLCNPLCMRDPRSNSLRAVGKDALGRVMFYSCFQTSHNRYDARANILHLQRLLEDAQDVLDADHTGPGRWVMFIDFHGFSISDASPTTAQLAVQLMQNYPERLGLAVLYDTGTLFETMSSVVRPLLNEITAAKVCFASSLEGDLDPSLKQLGPEALNWYRAEIAENRADFADKKNSWLDQGGFPESSGERPEGLAPHDPRGLKSFVNSEIYSSFLNYGEDPGDTCVPVVDFTVDKLFDGKIGVRLKGLIVSGLDITEAGDYWNIGDEVLEVNGNPVGDVEDFRRELKEAVQALPFTVKVFRHGPPTDQE